MLLCLKNDIYVFERCDEKQRNLEMLLKQRMYHGWCFDITCNSMQEKCVYLDLINHACDKICTYRVLQL